MNESFAKMFCYVSCMAAALLSTGCVPGLAHNTVIYNRDTNRIPGDPLGRVAEQNERVLCHGSVEVLREHGIFYLLGADGPWWQHKSFYGMYFRHGPESPNEFYLKICPDRKPVQTLAVKGKVLVEGRQVLIDIEYQDDSGRWKRPPINGHRKIDSVFPDDGPHPPSKSETR